MKAGRIVNLLRILTVSILINSCEKNPTTHHVDHDALIVVGRNVVESSKRIHFSKPSYYRSLHTALVSVVENEKQSPDTVIGDSLRARHPLEINSSDDEKLISLIREFISDKIVFGDALQSFGWMHIIDSSISDVNLRSAELIVNNKNQTFAYFECGSGPKRTYYMSPQVVDLYGVSKSVGHDRILVCMRTHV